MEYWMLGSMHPRRRAEVETYVLPDGSSLLFDPETEAGHPLDVWRSLIWDYCDGALAADAIAGEIVALVPQIADAAEFTRAVLDEFAQAGLLVPPASAPQAVASAGQGALR
jgi:hypothetical protein